MSEIQKIRKEKGLSQAELAKLAGISEISIRKYENGQRRPKIQTLEKIARALDVPLANLTDDILINSVTQIMDTVTEEYGLIKYKGNEENDIFEITEEYIISELQKLNLDGQIRILNHIEDLLKVDEYLKENTPDSPQTAYSISFDP